MNARVVWTPKTRKRVEPRRGAKPAKRIKRDPEKAWADVRKIWALIESRCDIAIATRLESQGDVHVNLALTEAAAARFKHVTSPPAPHDSVVCAAMRGLVEFAAWKENVRGVTVILANHFLAAGGAPLAIAALARAPKFWWASLGNALAVRDQFKFNSPWDYYDFHIGPWRAVRAELATLDDASYAAARDVAAPLFDEGDIGLKSAIGFAFPSERAWVNAATDACLALGSTHAPHCITPLLASLDDVDRVERVVAWAKSGIEWGPSLVDGIGVAAAPALRTIFEHARGASDRRSALAALALVESDEVADFMATLADAKDVRAIVFDYFSRSPDLAARALAGKKGEAAKIFAALGQRTS